MTIAEIRDWLKVFGGFENYYIGKLDAKKEKSLGVYNRTSARAYVDSIGHNTSYDVKAVSLLIHWNKNARETEEAALALFDKLTDVSGISAGDNTINYLMLMVPEPQFVGSDDNGVYEFVIEFDLYTERK